MSCSKFVVLNTVGTSKLSWISEGIWGQW